MKEVEERKERDRIWKLNWSKESVKEKIEKYHEQKLKRQVELLNKAKEDEEWRLEREKLKEIKIKKFLDS